MIVAHCRTNLDDYRRTRWPTRFVTVPRKGDRVQGMGSNRPEMTAPVLTVCGVTHKVDRNGAPYIEVELHRGF